MIGSPSVRTVLRAIAVMIAIAGAFDPAITSKRTSKPVVAVVTADPAHDSVLARRVARELDQNFTVIGARFAAADATVLVGNRPPTDDDVARAPVFGVFAAREGPTVTLDAVHAPSTAPFEARVPITTVVRVTGARGRTLDVTLRSGDLVVDRATRTVATDDEHVTVPLSFVPTITGPAPLRVSAAVGGAGAVANADVLVDVRDQRWSVLFFDPRPSWMSTFVRRAVERDRRFVVTSRVVTSRNISIDAGRPPERLDDIAGLSRFDAVVVGAPEALTETDVTGLNAFLRRRGGGVVLLFDQRVAGPYERLTDVGSWLTRGNGREMTIAPVVADSGALRVSEIAWPSSLPAGASPVAQTVRTPTDSSPSRAVVWRSPVGAGELVVSGALDAWRYRDRSVSAFDEFWQTLIASTASATPPPLAVTVSPSIVAAGERIDVTAAVRDVALGRSGDGLLNGAPVRATVSGSVVTPAGGDERRIAVRFWPSEAIGGFRAVVRAPRVPGVYHVAVASDGFTADVPIVVATARSRPEPDGGDLLTAWVTARGGRAIASSRLGDLSAALQGVVRSTPRMERWHPMRSAWWIVPFVLALGGEWWLRRRRGFA
jgi:hypothetical protein